MLKRQDEVIVERDQKVINLEKEIKDTKKQEGGVLLV